MSGYIVTVKTRNYNKLAFQAEKIIDVYGLLQTIYQYGKDIESVMIEEIQEPDLPFSDTDFDD